MRLRCRTIAALSGGYLLATLSAHAQAAPPHWNGLWETDVAAELISGKLTASPASADSGSGASLDPLEQAFLRRTVILGKPPYNAEWARKSSRAGQAPATIKMCTVGFPAMMDNPTPDGLFEVLVTPELTLFLFPHGEVRHIYTDGRLHPRAEDLWPTALGDSIGHWEGSTLVVDTMARIAGPVVPLPGAADLSAQARFTERIRLIDEHTMANDLTIDDPARFEHPWGLSIRYERVIDMDRMIPTNCAESDRNPVIDGRVVITPPSR